MCVGALVFIYFWLHIYLSSRWNWYCVSFPFSLLFPLDLIRSMKMGWLKKNKKCFLLYQVQKAGGLLGVTSRGLLILGLLLVFILILLVIIVVLAALWPRTAAQEAPKVCDTPACLRAAAQVFSFFIFYFFFFFVILLPLHLFIRPAGSIVFFSIPLPSRFFFFKGCNDHRISWSSLSP